jgi:hypothetical protein
MILVAVVVRWAMALRPLAAMMNAIAKYRFIKFLSWKSARMGLLILHGTSRGLLNKKVAPEGGLTDHPSSMKIT